MACIESFKDKTPLVGERCFIAPTASLVGDVRLGNDCSVWYSAVLRADVDRIVVGNEVNIQDGAVIHQSNGAPVVIEDHVSIGHLAMIHGCTIRKNALIGMQATVLDGAEVGENAVVAAGAVVLQNTRIGAGELWAGVPARFIKMAEEGQAAEYADHYLEVKQFYPNHQ